jgi:two-component system phosphate regulon sensor histidine kinase PhoR
MLTKPNMLVVENDVAILNKCSQLLLGKGFEVTTAQSSKGALQILEKYRRDVDILLLSLELPGLGAMSIIEVLKKTKSGILVMAMSADCGEEAIEAIHAGAYDCIRKTFTTERFWTKIDRVVERFTLARQLEIVKKQRLSVLMKDSYDEDTMRAIMNTIPEGLIVTDHHERIVFYNSKAADLFGLEGDTALGLPIGKTLKNTDFVSFITEPMNLSRSGHQKAGSIEIGGMMMHVLTNSIEGDNGKIIGFVSMLHDVSKKKTMDQLKGDIVSMVSHELKAPLSALLMQLSVVLDGLAGDITTKQKELLGKAKQRTKRMIALVNDLLDLRRIEEGKVVVEIEPLDLGEILHRSIDIMALSAKDKNINFDIKIAENLPLFSGDRTGMEAVFVNLISNAIKYTSTGGRVQVELKKAGKDLRLKVVDNGIGIEKEDLDHVFDRFYRIKTEQTKSIGGSGLGLYIVKRIVDAHNGTTHVESKVGKGSMFIISLPVEK